MEMRQRVMIVLVILFVVALGYGGYLLIGGGNFSLPGNIELPDDVSLSDPMTLALILNIVFSIIPFIVIGVIFVALRKTIKNASQITNMASNISTNTQGNIPTQKNPYQDILNTFANTGTTTTHNFVQTLSNVKVMKGNTDIQRITAQMVQYEDDPNHPEMQRLTQELLTMIAQNSGNK